MLFSYRKLTWLALTFIGAGDVLTSSIIHTGFGDTAIVEFAVVTIVTISASTSVICVSQIPASGIVQTK